MAILVFSRSADGDKQIAEHFKVEEFRCKDGTDPIFVDEALVELLEQVRTHFGRAVTVTSGYRTSSHNSRVGGSAKSQHLYGRAADIQVDGVEPETVAAYVETLLDGGGLGIYPVKPGRDAGWVHIDTRDGKSRWTL